MEWTPVSTVCVIAGVLLAYLLGSVDFAIIITRLFGKGDIRKLGSGNAGMTNVLRSVGKAAAGLTLLGDFCKGIISVIMMRLLLQLFAGVNGLVLCDYLAAYAALLGHIFPLYYHFKGGKGILVSAGALLILSPWSLLCCLIAFLILTAATRYVSVGSIAAGICYPLANILVTYLQYQAIRWDEVILALPITLIVIFMHRQNIVRLLNHSENKLSFKKK